MKLTVYSDGASKGNPGDAGIGVVIASDDGEVLREISDYIGTTTNNAAEYAALIRGLKEAVDLGATRVEVCTDSELLAFQLTGIYRVRAANLAPLHEQAVTLLRAFSGFQITRLSREFNQRADRLANDAIKSHRKSKTPESRQ